VPVCRLELYCANILNRSWVIDMHTHVQFAERFPRRNLARRHLNLHLSLPRWGNARIDIPALRAAGVNAMVASIYAMEFPFLPAHLHFENALADLRAIERLTRCYADDLVLVRSGGDLDAARQSGRVGLIVALEGAHALGSDIARLETLHESGLRSLQPAHWLHNACVKANWSWWGRGQPLMEFGREVVKRANELGILLDVAHMSSRALRDVFELADGPVICSHAGARALCNAKRNLFDEEIRALAATGGVLGMTFYPFYLRRFSPLATLGRMVEHIDHVVQLVGPEHVGLGSDYNGAPAIICGLRDYRGLPEFVERLLARGYRPEDIAGILGGNFRRAFVKTCGKPHHCPPPQTRVESRWEALCDECPQSPC